ncbi:MAG: hypothetical protein M5R40_06850 [Anaerolineae bacterium]|nr:hypothetical protein [Anaerolineae bacterium]
MARYHLSGFTLERISFCASRRWKNEKAALNFSSYLRTRPLYPKGTWIEKRGHRSRSGVHRAAPWIGGLAAMVIQGAEGVEGTAQAT